MPAVYETYDTPSGFGLLNFWFYNNFIPSGLIVAVRNPEGMT